MKKPLAILTILALLCASVALAAGTPACSRLSPGIKRRAPHRAGGVACDGLEGLQSCPLNIERGSASCPA